MTHWSIITQLHICNKSSTALAPQGFGLGKQVRGGALGSLARRRRMTGVDGACTARTGTHSMHICMTLDMNTPQGDSPAPVWGQRAAAQCEGLPLAGPAWHPPA